MHVIQHGVQGVSKSYVDRLARQVHDRISRARASAGDTLTEVERLKQQVNLLAAAQLQLISGLVQRGAIPDAEAQACVASMEAVLRATEEPPPFDWSALAEPQQPQAADGQFDWGALPPSRPANLPGEAFLE
jgi:hypothetical protein